MAKPKIAYVCSECGADHSKWQGQCSACKEWNTLQEFKISSSKSAVVREGYAGGSLGANKVVKLNEVSLEDLPRFSSGMGEFDRVLGGGLVPGSVNLVGGHPGAGKSTLLLQIMCFLSQKMPVLYITGEESLQQVALRAQRLKLPIDKLQMLTETDVEQIVSIAKHHQPRVMVIDSIQVMHTPGVESA
ncbi:DNA repair protein RadA, partial [Bermanella sp. 47_1433_sub80_T6]